MTKQHASGSKELHGSEKGAARASVPVVTVKPPTQVGSKTGSLDSIRYSLKGAASAKSINSVGSKLETTDEIKGKFWKKIFRHLFPKKSKQNEVQKPIIIQFLDYCSKIGASSNRVHYDPYNYCISVPLWLSIPFLCFLIWDLLAVLYFEMPHYSMINFPGVMMTFQFTTFIMSIYGYIMDYAIWSRIRSTKLSFISVVIASILLMWRIFMEFAFNGFRGQNKLYLATISLTEPIFE